MQTTSLSYKITFIISITMIFFLLRKICNLQSQPITIKMLSWELGWVILQLTWITFILMLQETLKSAMVSKANLTVELIGKQVRVHEDMAIFITMNPTYAGRSNLPDNLKKLFRSLAMTAPDMTMIAEVTLFSQGWILKYFCCCFWFTRWQFKEVAL